MADTDSKWLSELNGEGDQLHTDSQDIEAAIDGFTPEQLGIDEPSEITGVVQQWGADEVEALWVTDSAAPYHINAIYWKVEA